MSLFEETFRGVVRGPMKIFKVESFGTIVNDF